MKTHALLPFLFAATSAQLAGISMASAVEHDDARSPRRPACSGKHVEDCSRPYPKKPTASARDVPKYCEDTNNSNARACFGTAPKYCEDPNYSTTQACYMSAPKYCETDSNRGNDFACIAAAPRYCTNTNYASYLACLGSRPKYCEDTNYANSISCASDALVNNVLQSFFTPYR